MKKDTPQTSSIHYSNFIFFCLALFILFMGCEEEAIEKDTLEVKSETGPAEILRNHFYRERFIDYPKVLCPAGGISMYMLEVWEYEDTITLARRRVYDTLNLYCICRREDLPNRQYSIDATARPGIDTSNPADTLCLPNAMRIVAYEDRNQNKGFEEEEEAISQLSFCHGIFSKGAIVVFQEELSHDCCPTEGWRINSGQDDNGDDTLQDSEIDDTVVRCNEL